MNAAVGNNMFPFPSAMPKTLSSPSFLCPLPSSTPSPYRSLALETVQGQVSDDPPAETISRRLILLRHAKSSWGDRSLRDHDRPLSKNGRAAAVEISHKLQQMGWIPELILSSDAMRTKETLKIMQEQVRGFLEAEVHFLSSFYSIAAMDGQTAEHLQHAICNFSRDEILTVIFYSIAAMDGQTAEHLQHAICNFSRDEILTVMCMGHNRGWEEAASMFSGTLVELKTCNAALLEAHGKTWEEAFSLAGFGGWKLQGIVKPNSNM